MGSKEQTQEQKQVIQEFCDESIEDCKVINSETLKRFTELYTKDDEVPVAEENKLQGRFFLGVNVKTDSEEKTLKPIPFWSKVPGQNYKPDQTTIADGGRIMDLFVQEGDTRPEQMNRFTWNPNKWNPNPDEAEELDIFDTNSAVLDNSNDHINQVFRTAYGPDYVKDCTAYGPDYVKNRSDYKYNILGDIYYNALGMKKEDCHVLIYFFDYDLSNSFNLSFILAVCEQKSDMELVESKLGDLVNYIMLVKARYVRNIQRQRQVESVKSAVAAIMSRNMSHNLGSHYLYYTKTQLAALANKHKNFAPDIRGAATVLGYMQARMDYLATIVSGDRYPYGSVFFKGQIFDELTIDDFSKRHFLIDDADPDRIYKRTTNYLLQNLILSEDFTRPPVLDGYPSLLEEKKNDEGNNIIKKRKNIRLQIKIDQTDNGLFTGIADVSHINREKDAKMEISKIGIALPGGIMSIHAFYNVVENFIRNSAKYLKDDFKDDFKDELVITIAISELPAGKSSSGRVLPIRYRFVIYDNKGNAFASCSKRKLVNQMNHELVGLRILNDKNELDKSNKGLKEMLFSTLWMRAYTRKTTLSNILAKWDRMPIRSDKEQEEKMKQINENAFEYVVVDDDGNVKEPGDNGYVEEDNTKLWNLGIRFELPKYRMVENLIIDNLDENRLKEKGINNFTDIICVDLKGKDLRDIKTKFTRVYDEGLAYDEKDSEEAVEILRKILTRRFPDFDAYKVSMDGKAEKGYKECDKMTRGIHFETHEAMLSNMQKYAYCEAISGENFTKTMQDIFNSSFKETDDDDDLVKANDIRKDEKKHTDATSMNWWNRTVDKVNRVLDRRFRQQEMKPEPPKPKVRLKGDFMDGASEYFALKIKEAALTRITLVDERLYNDMKAHNKDEFLKCRNIRILNLKSVADNVINAEGAIVAAGDILVVKDLFDGNDFRDEKDATHFLSIHLGMIEKIVKDDSGWVKEQCLESKSLTERVNWLMEMIKNTFKTNEGELFVSIHSGRGNFSKELDESLKEYRFISISAIESVYANSKFLLAQLFYNTVFMGKGELNEQKEETDEN